MAALGIATGKRLVRGLSYSLGAARAYHRLRNRRTLTVIGLHRVLSPDDPRWNEAIPDYVVPAALFEKYVEFFAAHYNVVDVDQVLDCRRGGAPLPDWALLITFDDGWADTAEVAMPVLERAGMPAVVFVAATAVGRAAGFWQERWYSAWLGHQCSAASFASVWTSAAGAEPVPSDALAAPAAFYALIEHLELVDAGARERLLVDFRGGAAEPVVKLAHMATSEQILDLDRGGIRIGGHGNTHTRLTEVADVDAELIESRRRLNQLLGTSDAVKTMSFPHGRYNRQAVQRARAAGFELCCTSEKYLNPTHEGRILSDVLGRVFPETEPTTTPAGKFSPDGLANMLFRPPVVRLKV